MKEIQISMKKKLEFKANRSVGLMIKTDFRKEKTNQKCWWENFLKPNKRVVPNMAMLEGKFSKN